MEGKRTQDERSRTTRTALVGAARRLYADRPYAEVGTGEIVAAAGVTRGALYHQFGSKVELFAAVLEDAEQQLTDQIGGLLAAAADTGPLELLVVGAQAWLDACAAPDVQRIVLLDGPAVLGWERWREVGHRHGLGLTVAGLQAAMEAGAIRAQPVLPLAHLLVGALDEAALYVARAASPDTARAEVASSLRSLVEGLAGPAS